MKDSIKVLIFPLCAVFFMVFCITHPLECSFYTKSALDICATTLIPSLFATILLTKLICKTLDLPQNNKIAVSLSKFLGIPPCLLFVFIMGLFSGFPTGAVGVCDIYEKNLCSKAAAERAIALSNNCSFAFLISFAGAVLCKDIRIGVILAASQTLSVIVTSQLLKFTSKSTYCQSAGKFPFYKKEPLVKVFCASIKDTCTALLSMTGFVVFFCLFTNVLTDRFLILAGVFPNISETLNYIKFLISCIFEMTSAVFCAGDFEFPKNVVLISFATSLSGLSVLFQVKSICLEKGLCAKEFVFSHVCCAFLSAMFTILLLLI